MNVLEELENQLKSLRQRKKVLLTEVADVEMRMKRILAEHGRLTNRNASIYRLPNEILVQIFRAGQIICFGGRGMQLGMMHNHAQFEVLVSQISNHWRAVSIGTPMLWTGICSVCFHCKQQVAMYLERSKPCPLEIDFRFGSSQVKRQIAFLSLIATHVGRWQRVFIEPSIPRTYDYIVQTIRHSSAPLLEQFAICPATQPVDTTTRDHDYKIFTGGAPKLTFVRLAGPALHLSHPPFGAVTTLHLEDPHMDQSYMDFVTFRDIINASPALLNLSLYKLLITNWPTDMTSSTLHIPTLRSLRVYDMTNILFSVISAPYLESLVIVDCSDEEVPPLQSLEFPHLHTLTLSDCYLTSRTCRNIFHSLPAITHFELLGSFSTDILRALGDDSTLPSNLPFARLHTLTLERLETVQEHLLFSIVLSGRKQMGYPIKELRLETQLRIKLRRKKKLEWLEQLVEVVTWSSCDPWPPGAEFVDGDDLF